MLIEKAPPDNGELTENSYDKERWQTLRDRLADEIAKGYTFARVSREINVESAAIEVWAKDGSKFRSPSRWSDLPLAEIIEKNLEILFSDLDAERARKPIEPNFIETSVSRNIMAGFQRARALQVMVEIAAPPGSGKTWAMEQYLAQCRKTEGFDCPVWEITLHETNVSLKIILYEIAQKMRGQTINGIEPKQNDSEYWLQNQIEELATTRSQGLLIIDEAQHIGLFNGAVRPNGLNILNGLRRLCDRKMFGIAMLSNGEIYQRTRQSKSTQLSSRMEAWRVDAKRPTADDIDSIMSAWGVAGKQERAWCVKAGLGEGGLRAITSIFRASRHEYGAINYRTLMAFRRILLAYT